MTPNIYEYKNYREFLKDCYTHFKNSKSGFSYRYLANKAGLASSGYLYSIIAGERNLPPIIFIV